MTHEPSRDLSTDEPVPHGQMRDEWLSANRIVVLAGSYLALSWFAFLHGPLRHWGFHLFGPVGPTLWPTHWMLYVLGFL